MTLEHDFYSASCHAKEPGIVATAHYRVCVEVHFLLFTFPRILDSVDTEDTRASKKGIFAGASPTPPALGPPKTTSGPLGGCRRDLATGMRVCIAFFLLPVHSGIRGADAASLCDQERRALIHK